ncbi:MAG: S8/S53 family peptidase [Thermoplasmatota archaeon]
MALACVAISGCLQAPVAPGAHDVTTGSMVSARPVIAVLDSGISPYHLVFRDPNGTADAASRFRDATTGARPVEVPLDLAAASYASALAADTSSWNGLRAGVLYHFTGTRVLAIAFPSSSPPQPLIRDLVGHGTQTAGTAAAGAQDAWILMVQVPLDGVTTGTLEQDHQLADVQITNAMRWVTKQPWVDVVSLSFGAQRGAPAPTDDAFAKIVHTAVDLGKVVIAAAGNSPLPDLGDPYDASPWSIIASGADPKPNGRTLSSGSMLDVVAPFTAKVPREDSFDGYRWVDGTSFSAPAVAGEIARVIESVRAAWGPERPPPTGALAFSPTGTRLTPWRVRDALNASAKYWNTTDWNPTRPQSEDNSSTNTTILLVVGANAPAPPVAPWTLMGWGFVDHSVGDAMVRRILANDTTMPPEKAQAAQFMDGMYAAREAYWAASP